MRQIFLAVLIIILQFSCINAGLAQDWYARNLYEVKAQKNQRYKMVFVTKVDGKDACNTVIAAKGTDVGRWKNTSNRCLSGEEAEESYSQMFKGMPVAMAYISFIDNFGWPTRISFTDAPDNFTEPIIEGLAASLKEQKIDCDKYIRQNCQKFFPPKSSKTFGICPFLMIIWC